MAKGKQQPKPDTKRQDKDRSKQRPKDLKVKDEQADEIKGRRKHFFS